MHPLASLSSPGTRAVVIGTGDHTTGSRLTNVPAVRGTVTDLAACLTGSCGLPASQVRTVVDPRDPETMDVAIRASAAEADDVFLLYYVGHGVLSPSGELHLATHATIDLTRGRAASQALEFSAINDSISRCRASTTIVILDCCFSGRAHLGEVSEGYLIASATGEATALAPKDAPYTLFSGELIRLLRDGDSDGPPRLTLQRVAGHLHRVLREHGRTPVIRSAGRSGELVMSVNPAYRPPAHPPPAADGWPLPGTENLCPYVGLASYGPVDTRLFFGREEMTGRLVRAAAAQLFSAGPLIVTGASGAGKSSLLNAGLIPALGRGELGVPGSGRWPLVLMTPGAEILTDLSARVSQASGIPVGDVEAAFRDSPARTVQLVRRALPEPISVPSGDDDRRMVWIIDQFEEVFAPSVSQADREAFLRVLLAVSAGDRPPVLVVIAVRADFLDHLASYEDLAPAIRHAQFVGPMTRGQLREAITQPCESVGHALEAALVELLLHDLGMESADDSSQMPDPGSLPLLSHALLGTWNNHTGRMLTVADYQMTGGIRGAIAATAESVHDSLDETGRDELHRLLLRMVSVGDGTRDVRRRLPHARLWRRDVSAATTTLVLDALVKARLVTATAQTVEITHEALISAWPRLREWIEADRAGLLVRQQLIAAADAWTGERQDPDLLYRGTQLAIVRERFAEPSSRETLAPPVLAFLDASVALERRRTRLRRRAVGSLSALTVIALIATGLAARQAAVATAAQADALRQRDIAISRQVTVQAAYLNRTQPGLARQLLAVAYRTAVTDQATGALLTSHSIPGEISFPEDITALAHQTGGPVLGVATGKTVTMYDTSAGKALSTVSGGTNAITGMSFSPDGSTLATHSDSPSVQLWDVAVPARPRRLARLTTGRAKITTLAFSPVGNTLATIGTDKTVRLWDIADPRAPSSSTIVTRLSGGVSTLAFSPDGRLLAIAAWGEKVRLWRLSGLKRPVVLSGVKAGDPNAVAFSPDSRVLAVADSDGTLREWDTSNPARPVALSTFFDNRLVSVADDLVFSSDGRILIAAGFDLTLWDVSDHAHPTMSVIETGYTAGIHGLAFSSDGRTLATSALNRTVRLWNMADPKDSTVSATATGHTAAVDALAFSPGGHVLATGGDDDTVRLWDVDDPLRPKEVAKLQSESASGVASVGFGGDGRTLVAGRKDGTTEAWDLSTPLRPRVTAILARPMTQTSVLAFSADGYTVVVGNGQTKQVWSLTPDRPRSLGTFTGPPGVYSSMALGPDGHTLLTTSRENTAQLWDISDLKHPVPVATLTGHTAEVQAVAFSPDGHTAATGSGDRSVNLWDVNDPAHPKRVAKLTGHTEDVGALAFSPDGRTLATGDNRTVLVWDVADATHPQNLATFTGDGGAVSALAFSPEGDILAAAGADGVVRMWAMRPEKLLRQLCANAGDPITPAQWSQYLEALDYKPPCR
ncbi:caspase family protein [Streptosporangium sp. NPDC087985]|uniref:caspase, EACC1-associated type n=1 Tax=Streptosporangium sp. NPDC087985 TaxID=3366196 RepID=UPI0038203334